MAISISNLGGVFCWGFQLVLRSILCYGIEASPSPEVYTLIMDTQEVCMNSTANIIPRWILLIERETIEKMEGLGLRTRLHQI